MNVKPLIFEKIYTMHTSFRIDFQIDFNITFIKGDSGSGKSVVYSFLEELAVEDQRIKCFNYLDVHKRYKSSIKRSAGKLFVFDNADLLLDDSIRQYIAWDEKNQYMIMGRNPTGLLLNYDEVYELQHTKQGEITTFTLQRQKV